MTSDMYLFSVNKTFFLNVIIWIKKKKNQQNSTSKYMLYLTEKHQVTLFE